MSLHFEQTLKQSKINARNEPPSEMVKLGEQDVLRGERLRMERRSAVEKREYEFSQL